MTKQRHCFVTDVGLAIEKLADALDPERSKLFGGDILDLLEWAERDVLEMRQQVTLLRNALKKYAPFDSELEQYSIEALAATELKEQGR